MGENNDGGQARPALGRPPPTHPTLEPPTAASPVLDPFHHSVSTSVLGKEAGDEWGYGTRSKGSEERAPPSHEVVLSFIFDKRGDTEEKEGEI